MRRQHNEKPRSERPDVHEQPEWVVRARESFPALVASLDDGDTMQWELFNELLKLSHKAHRQNDVETLAAIYAFTEWAILSDDDALSNTAGTAFYEHLGEHSATRHDIPKWIKPEVMVMVIGPMSFFMGKEACDELLVAYNAVHPGTYEALRSRAVVY